MGEKLGIYNMLLGFAVFIVFLAVSSFLGHFVHWALHQRWTGRAYKGHMQHHQLYPPSDLTSRTYRKPDWFNTGPFLFTPVFLVIIALMGGLALLLGVHLAYVGAAGAGLAAFGLFSDAVHDSFHIEDCWLSRFSAWRRLRMLHFIHHRNAKRNFGITTYVWDKLFGSFIDR